MIRPVERLDQIKKRRTWEAAWSVFTSIGIVELLFASFAFGASFGPGPLRPLELMLGLAASFFLGCIVAIPIARRRVERGARFSVLLHEGRRERRVVVFEDYFTIGAEIVLDKAITQAEIEAQGLVLRYRDPSYEGAVLRELAGDRVTLERLVSAMSISARNNEARVAMRA